MVDSDFTTSISYHVAVNIGSNLQVLIWCFL